MGPHDHTSRRAWLAALALAGCALAPSGATAASAPPNDDFANAADLGGASPASASGSTLWATAEPGEPGTGYGAPSATVWYRWTAPVDAVMQAGTCRSTFDTILAVYRGTTLRRLGRVAANDEWCRDRSRLRFLAVAGTVYHLAVGGFRGAQGAVELRLRALEPPDNDDLAGAADLGAALPSSAEGSTRDATVEPREPAHAGRPRAATVWYRWTATADRTVVAGTCRAGFDSVLAVYRGKAHDALRPVAANDDACGRGSQVRFRAVAGRTYALAVAGFGRSEGDFRLRLRGVRTPQRGID